MMDDASKEHSPDLAAWVMGRVEEWQQHYNSNYRDKHEEYYRLWRGIWAEGDKTRKSERSKLIAPALQQAVESSVAEVEEATFGRGEFFDLRDNYGDQNPDDIAQTKQYLCEDFKRVKVRKAVGEALLVAAYSGTGLMECVIDESIVRVPATEPLADSTLMAVGVSEQKRVLVRWRSVLPQNFAIDPNATSVEEALGVAVDEFVSRHFIEQQQESGNYRDDVDVGPVPSEQGLEADPELSNQPQDKCRLTRYYGLVPKYLLDAAIADPEEGEEIVSLTGEDEEKKDETYVESIVIIANGGKILKVEENPFMMRDRPIVAFQWELVPGRFWGRGVCEKGYNSQKALDAELRARADALALTVHPMMAVDATRMPRGAKAEVYPGKTILTNGNPAEVLMPFKFGQLDQVTFQQAGDLMQMVQMATGAIDSAGMDASVNGETKTGAMSMALGAIMKRHKRTLVNFQESCLIPMVEKTAWRYMQFDPERYKAADYDFIASSSLGIIAREYEVQQLSMLAQTLGPNSPITPSVVRAIVQNMSLYNRDELLSVLDEAAKPDPEAAKFKQMQQELLVRDATASVAVKEADAKKKEAEAVAEIEDIKNDRLRILTTNLPQGQTDDDAFQKRAKIAELMLKEKDINAKVAMVEKQTNEDIPGAGMGKDDKVMMGMSNVLGEVLATNKELIKSLNSKKRVVRDDKGRVLGVEAIKD